MVPDLAGRIRPPLALIALLIAQIGCAVFFVADVVADFTTPPLHEFHLSIEVVAGLTLIATAAAQAHWLMTLLRRQVHLQRSASLAASAMSDVIEAHFTAWSLTPSEHDIAYFLVKGLSIAEIARIRGSAEGTVKSHLNAIYRKSGSQNRGELLAQIIDSLMDDGSVGSAAPSVSAAG